jgi:hexosaminidase
MSEAGLVPLPAKLRRRDGQPFTITRETGMVEPGGTGQVAEALRRSTGLPLPAAAAGGVRLELAGSAEPEAYALQVDRAGVLLRAGTVEGLFRGVQTLRQLLTPEGTVPAIEIEDRPRFGWRGAMLDPARHFFTVDDVKRYLDLIAMYKLNLLHLHLTDDQGWRIAIDRWPRLASADGHYSQQDYLEIVTYAAERFIAVVPEIDFPGHTGALRQAYPDIWRDGRPSEPLFGLLDDVVREVAALTPGRYVHIGGDEAYDTDPDDYRTFLRRAEEIVYAHGKTMVGWAEIGQVPLRRQTVVQYWGTAGGQPEQLREQATEALGRGHRLVMSPADRIYLDMKYDRQTALGLDWAGYVEVPDSYGWDPVSLLDGVAEPDVLGVEAPLWGETALTIRDAEYLAFPRLLSAAEIGWSPAAGRSWDEYRHRLVAQAPRWDALSVNYYRSPLVPWPQP